MIDIIMPHYKEPWSVGKKFFSMLNLQRGVDFKEIRVILVNDGKDNDLPAEYFSDCPYQVTQISIPKSGVSAARNRGIEEATADWIMFCDFDDMFATVYALAEIMSILPADDKDLLVKDYYIERFDVNHKLTRRIQDTPMVTMVHGFLIKRKFLMDSGIRFDTDLTFDEDYDFMLQVALSIPKEKIGKINTTAVPYIYCVNDGSVTAQTNRYNEKIRNLFIRLRKQTALYKEKGMTEDYKKSIVNAIYGMYFSLNVTPLCEELLKVQRDFSKWYIEDIGSFPTISDNDRFGLWQSNKAWVDQRENRDKIKWLKKDDIPKFNSNKTVEQWLKEVTAN